MSNRFDRPESPNPSLEGEPIHTEVISIQAIADFVDSHRNPTTMILFGGDRLTCCDEGVGVKLGNKLVGIATIAPRGEESSGVPTIVGVYVDKSERRKQVGQQLVEAAVRRCQERGFTRIHIDVMSAGMKRIVDSLPTELRAFLEIQDCGDIVGDF